jgi:hypothetical protein
MPLLEFIEKEYDTRTIDLHALLLPDEHFVEKTRGTKWWIDDSLYGTWIVSTNDLDDLHKLSGDMYWWCKAQKSWFWRLLLNARKALR